MLSAPPLLLAIFVGSRFDGSHLVPLLLAIFDGSHSVAHCHDCSETPKEGRKSPPVLLSKILEHKQPRYHIRSEVCHSSLSLPIAISGWLWPPEMTINVKNFKSSLNEKLKSYLGPPTSPVFGLTPPGCSGKGSFGQMNVMSNEEGALSYLFLSRMDIGLLLQLPNRGFLPQHLGLLLGSATSCTIVRLTLLNVITI